MKLFVALLMLLGVALPAYAGPAPEIDGSLTVQVVALVGGLAMLLKRRR